MGNNPTLSMLAAVKTGRPLRLLLLVTITFVAELAMMLFFRFRRPVPSGVEIIYDAFLLIIITFPFFYFLLFRTLAKEIAEHRRDEKKIQAQNKFLRKIIQSLPHPFYVIDADSYEIKLSNRPKGAVGHSVKTKCFALTHGESSPCSGDHPCPLIEVKKTGMPVVVEHIHYNQDGEPHHVEVHGFPVFDESGKLVQMIESSLDITERKKAEGLLQEEKRLSSSLVEYSAVPTFVLGPDHKVIYWNKACEDLTGIRAAEVVGTAEHWRAFCDQKCPCLADLVIADNKQRLSPHYQNCKSSSLPHGLHAEQWFANVNGKRLYIISDAAPIYDSRNELVAVIETMLDITKHKKLEEKFEQDASIDRLTGIYNRHKLEELLTREVERADRYGNSLSLIMFDLDDFKAINDNYGHDGGDSVLKSIAELVRQHLRKTDLLGRWGGEEFLIVATETTEGNAGVLAEKLRSLVEEEHFGKISWLTMSCGVSQYRPGEPILDFLKRVDEALYEAKRNGRNQVQVAVR